jgi:hypothetical protein
MLSQDDFESLSSGLREGQPQERVYALRSIIEGPTRDTRLLPQLEALLKDDTPCVVSLPYLFGEVRWLAAHALASERASLGQVTPVQLKAVPRPQEMNALALLAQQHGIQHRGGVPGMLELFALLRQQGLLPVVDLTLPSH